MDVDLLRPGTVPMSKDTILWFEFLLNPSLLEQHLNNPNGDPTPAELMVKLLTMSEHKSGVEGEVLQNGGKLNLSFRSLGLKVLALKVFAFLHWDLDIIEDKLPLPLQWMLLKDLLCLVSEEYSDPSCHPNLDLGTLSPELTFAILLYHRWVLRSYVKQAGTRRLNPPSTPVEEGGQIVSESESDVSACLLEKVCSLRPPPTIVVPLYTAIVPLTEDNTDIRHRWHFAHFVSPHHFRCQVLMEVGMYAMHREWYPLGRNVISVCKAEFGHMDGSVTSGAKFCKVTREDLSGMCLALGLEPPYPRPPSLTMQFLTAIATLDVGKLLEMDNVEKEIPMNYRDSFELDIESELASGKVTAQRDGLTAIQAANTVRRALDNLPRHRFNIPPTPLNKAIMGVVGGECGRMEKERLGLLLLELLTTQDTAYVRELADTPCVHHLLSTQQITDAQESDYADPLPSVLLDPDCAPQPKNSSAVFAAIERQIISSYDPQEIKSAIVKLWAANPQLVIEKINRNWEVPIPLYNVIMGLTNGVSQNYIYLLLCKAYQLDKMKNFSLAQTLLRVALDEISQLNGQSKLSQLVLWEILLVDIHQFHNDWPAKHMDWTGLGEECRRLVETEGVLLPRVTLREDACLTLLNMGRWIQLTSSTNNKLLPQTSQLYLTLAAVCLDVKFNRKPTLDLWDKVLSVVSSKGRNEGLTQLSESLCRIVDVTALTVVASLLAKLHNILTDQPSSDLYVHLIQLWPNSVKNVSHLNSKWVMEVLWELVNHAIHLYPNNMAWSKLLGDLHFASGHYASALKCYLEAVIAGSDYFARPVTLTILEDHFIKKMVRSCIQLQCHSQAGVLCQLLEEVDYTSAFKSLQEGSSWDAMDSYYSCIWDITLLEFLISLHTKRNEHYRKQRAILMMGLLELNSNNNEEIKREAENIRKSKFLRAMAKQYIC